MYQRKFTIPPKSSGFFSRLLTPRRSPNFDWPKPAVARSICPLMSSAENDTTADSMVTRDLVVTNKVGIHARPAAMFVKVASRFDAEIFLEKDGERINGKSIMGLLMLAAGPGCRLRLEVSGADAEQAAKELEELFNKKFGED